EYRRIAPVRVLGVSHGVIATQQVAQFSESSRYVVVDGLITELGEVLIEIGYTQLLRLPQFAAVRGRLPVEQLHERGLAGAILAQNADALALVNSQINPVQQRFVTIGESEICQAIQQHASFRAAEPGCN